MAFPLFRQALARAGLAFSMGILAILASPAVYGQTRPSTDVPVPSGPVSLVSPNLQDEKPQSPEKKPVSPTPAGQRPATAAQPANQVGQNQPAAQGQGNQEPTLPAEQFAALGGETAALDTPNMVGDLLNAGCATRTMVVLVANPPIFVAATPATPATPGTPFIPAVINDNGQIIKPAVPATPAMPGTPGTPAHFINVPPTPTTITVPVPAASHSFKIAENENVRPQDRVFFNFNYYDNVNGSLDRRLGADIGSQNVYRETFGFEKTFLDGNVSFGMRLPLNTIDASDGSLPGLGGTFTDVGDLAIIFKGLLWQDVASGNAVSGGLMITVPTGPDAFAGASSVVAPVHDTLFQPFVGFQWNLDRLYVHGFVSVDIPTDSSDSTLMFNDVGVGYFLLRNRGGDQFLTALAPTFEVHVNTPLSHRGAFACPGGTIDWVDLTEALEIEVRRRVTVNLGASVPVTGPKPYTLEAIAQVNVRF